MPGLKKTLSRRARRGFPHTPAIDDEVIMTGTCRDGRRGLLHIGLATDARALAMYRRALRSGTSVRFSVAGEVVALDLMAGPRVVGRILTSLANAVLIELIECVEVEVVPFLAHAPDSRDESFEFPASRIDVSLEQIYGEPEIHGHGPHISYELNKVSGEWTFFRHPTRAAAEAATPDKPFEPPQIDAEYDEPICGEFSIAGTPPLSWADRILGPPPAVN